MPSIPGTIVAAPVTTGHTDNTHPIGHQNEMQGGQHTALTLAARDAIPAARRVEGMTCWVQEDQRLYRLIGGVTNADWLLVDGGAPQYVHHQDVPSSSWTIVHNLGGHPAVTVLDSVNRAVFGQVTYLDTNTIRIDFSAGFSGRAYVVM